MLSLPEDWNYTTRGLTKVCKEGIYNIGSTLKEPEQADYIVLNRLWNSKSKIVNVKYVIYETPHPPDAKNIDMDNLCLENQHQLNKEKINPEEQNTVSSSTEGSNPI